jgi:small-conductance mechanosensitive channel
MEHLPKITQIMNNIDEYLLEYPTDIGVIKGFTITDLANAIGMQRNMITKAVYDTKNIPEPFLLVTHTPDSTIKQRRLVYTKEEVQILVEYLFDLYSNNRKEKRYYYEKFRKVREDLGVL